MWCTTETGQRRSILGIGRLFPSQPFAVPPAERKRGNTKMILRQELPKDYETVHHLIADSFATAEHSDGNEADLVAALRTGPSFVPALSRVAEVQGEIVGHILLTKAHVGSTTVLALAPLSVKPQFQRQGIGRALILDGHAVAKRLGLSVCTGPGKPGLLYKVRIRPSGTVSHRSPQGGPFRPSHGNLLVGKPRSHSRNPDLRERI